MDWEGLPSVVIHALLQQWRPRLVAALIRERLSGWPSDEVAQNSVGRAILHLQCPKSPWQPPTGYIAMLGKILMDDCMGSGGDISDELAEACMPIAKPKPALLALAGVAKEDAACSLFGLEPRIGLDECFVVFRSHSFSDIGYRAWSAAHLLLELFRDRPKASDTSPGTKSPASTASMISPMKDILAGKSVIELGSGTGVGALLLGGLSADRRPRAVLCTELYGIARTVLK